VTFLTLPANFSQSDATCIIECTLVSLNNKWVAASCYTCACNIPYLLLKYGHHKGRAAQIHAQLSLVLEPLGCPPNVHQLGKLQPSNFRQFQILIYGREVARPILISKGDCDLLSCCQLLCRAMEAVSSLQSILREASIEKNNFIMHGHLMSFGMSGEIREGQCSLLVHLSY
jgi:hypothetical protein